MKWNSFYVHCWQRENNVPHECGTHLINIVIINEEYGMHLNFHRNWKGGEEKKCNIISQLIMVFCQVLVDIPRYDYYDMHTRRVFEHQEKYHIFFSVLTGTFHSDIKCVGARSIKLWVVSTHDVFMKSECCRWCLLVNYVPFFIFDLPQMPQELSISSPNRAREMTCKLIEIATLNMKIEK